MLLLALLLGCVYEPDLSGEVVLDLTGPTPVSRMEGDADGIGPEVFTLYACDGEYVGMPVWEIQRKGGLPLEITYGEAPLQAEVGGAVVPLVEGATYAVDYMTEDGDLRPGTWIGTVSWDATFVWGDPDSAVTGEWCVTKD